MVCTGWLVGVFLLGGRFVCGVLALLEVWFAVLVCGGWGWGGLGWLRGAAGGAWGWLLGRWSAVRTALRCSAVGRRRGTHCALPGAKLRSDSRTEFDVEVRLAAHRPPHGLRSSPPAKSPPPHPTRRTTWVTGWCAEFFNVRWVTERLSAGTVLLPQHLPEPTWPAGRLRRTGRGR